MASNGRKQLNSISFTINKKTYNVSETIPAGTSLSSYIREYAKLTGTKTMCQEGGCGSCVVAVRSRHSVTGQELIYSVNSCLVPVFSCHGWDILTVEGLGDGHNGYHPLQLLLSSHNGSQCGFCSPGFVMSMFSLMEGQTQLTKEEIERSFGGHICRCTGYRPILEAFRSVASDHTKKPKFKCQDIEDMLTICLKNNKKTNHGKCGSSENCKAECLLRNPFPEKLQNVNLSESILLRTANDVEKWHRAVTKKDVFDILASIGDESYRFVAGNTAQGVYRDDKQYQNYIDINSVAELKSTSMVVGDGLTVGANISLTELETTLRQAAEKWPGQFRYALELADHICLVANVSIRNMATLAGNLCIKREHPEFPSDLALLLETVGVKITMEKDHDKPVIFGLQEFFTISLKKSLLTKIIFPPLDDKTFVVRTFKIMSRAQNVHAYVNAGFCFEVDKEAKFKVLQKPCIVFGGISSLFTHANKTEELLMTLGKQGKGLLDEEVLKLSLESLQTEIIPSKFSPGADPKYISGLSMALFYKCLLGLAGEAVAPLYRSGATLLSRPLSSSTRQYDTDKGLWPLNQPVPKVEALHQCSGEAQYIGDMPEQPGELHAALVLTSVGQGTITAIDASEALRIPGVVAFYSAEDIPGVNSFTSGFPDDEPVFCDKKVLYYGQPVGMVLAENQKLSLLAAKKVEVKYSNIGIPYLDMKEIVEKKLEERIIQQAEIKSLSVTDKTEDTVTVSGTVDLHDQYHMTMELQTCMCVPVEDGMDVYSSTQWMEHVHNAISKVLAEPAHRINMKVRRLGGGYGCKLTRSTWIAAQCAVAARLSNKPVRLVLPLETNMEVMGKRYNCFTSYKAEVNKKTGQIVKLEGDLYEDAGWSENDPVVEGTIDMLSSAYDSSTWTVKGHAVKTDKASNTWCRSPGSAEAIGTIEVIMDNIASTLGLNPLMVRLANIAPGDDNPIPSMIREWVQHTSYTSRLLEITKFNSENQWKKRGISVVPMTYKLYLASRYNAMVTIYAVDGTVAVTHGGIECGQGINTKVVQVCAYSLGVDMSMVQVKPTDILTSPNNEGTGGSVSSESVCYSVVQCCKRLLERLQPIRAMLPPNCTWQELIQKAYSEQVKLNATYLFTSNDGVKNYDIYGVTVAEVEVDILTGQHQVLRVDILEDAGVSLSPEIDVGQVEGAFIMGLGYYTLEDLQYSQDGRLLTNRTWNYSPPGPQDIPIDFRIQLRKDAPNPFGVLRSKATGEPPLCMSVAVPLAICHALSQSAATPYVQAFRTPLTPERTFLACKQDISLYKYA